MAKYILSDIFQGNYPVSQEFSARSEYYSKFWIYGIRQKGHEGVDFATPVGVPILAPFSGIILRQNFQSDFPNYGKVVTVWDPVQKCAVWFCHLSEEYVNNSQSVNKGQVLGKTGATGNVQGTHLHFGMVETDTYGNRLHIYDGYGGFIDLMGPLVEWKLSTPTTPLTCDQKINLIKQVLLKQGVTDTQRVQDVKKVLGI